MLCDVVCGVCVLCGMWLCVGGVCVVVCMVYVVWCVVYVVCGVVCGMLYVCV